MDLTSYFRDKEYLKGKIFVALVEDNKDPKHLGRIKARTQSILEDIPVDHLPWASPYKDLVGKDFKVPATGKIVNIIYPGGNIYEPHYIYSENYNINLQNKLKDLGDDEYLNFVALLFDHVTQVYSDDTGLNMDYMHNRMTIGKTNIDIHLKDNDQILNLGNEKASESAVLGDHFMKWMDDLVQTLLTPTTLTGNLGAPILKPQLDQVLTKYQALRPTFLSNSVKIVDNNKCLTSQFDKKRKETPTLDDSTALNNQKPLDSVKVSQQAKDDIKDQRKKDLTNQENNKPNPKDVTASGTSTIEEDEKNVSWSIGTNDLKFNENLTIKQALETPPEIQPSEIISDNIIADNATVDQPTGSEYEQQEQDKQDNIDKKLNEDPYGDFWSGYSTNSTFNPDIPRENPEYGSYVSSDDKPSGIGSPESFKPSTLPKNFTDKKARGLIASIIKAMRKKNYIIYLKPYQINMVGIRAPINTNINKFNDWMVLFWWEKDGDNNQENCKYKLYRITTVPGINARTGKDPMAPDGSGWLIESQFVDMYKFGYFNIGSKTQVFDTLVTNKPVQKVYRSKYNSAAILTSYKQQGPYDAGMFVHRSSYAKSGSADSINIGKWSYGCQVFAILDNFLEFYSILNTSKQKTGKSSFTYTILAESDVNTTIQ